jgi:D-beta-D-heptose 7-phosphate kinase / D-beta-D-heptose 1-phosphate adenosyltransferase
MRTGLLTGCFDLFHEGHRYFLNSARRQCDYLIVAVNTDESVRRLKGDDRPRDSLTVRMMRVNSYADATIPFERHTLDLIRAIHPDVLIKGWDQNSIGQEFAGETVRISRLPGFSTTQQVDNVNNCLKGYLQDQWPSVVRELQLPGYT